MFALAFHAAFPQNRAMKALVSVLSYFTAIAVATAGPVKGVGRTIGELDVIPTAVLQRSISPKFYKSLLISPLHGWVIVRGSLSGTRLTGLRVVHSEPDGLNDHLALQRAREVQLAGNYSIERPNSPSPVLVHLLLYKTADGTAALSFAHVDGAGGNQMQYYGCAKLSVLKDDGRWVDIKGPETLEGKGVAVRQGLKNDLNANLKLDSMSAGAQGTNYGR
jgi:hypothetical protein